MTRQELVDAINDLVDEATIREVSSAAKIKMEWIFSEKRRKADDDRKAQDRETMRSISGWKPGDTVYFGRQFSRGTVYIDPFKVISVDIAASKAATIRYVQPRSRRVWLKVPGIKTQYRDNLLPVGPDDIRRYAISRTEIAIRKSA